MNGERELEFTFIIHRLYSGGSHVPIRLIVAETGHMRWFRQLSLWTAVLAWVVIVLGGLVRATGSTLGCRTWPLCNGGLAFTIAPGGLTDLWHRLAAMILGLALLLLLRITLTNREHLHRLSPRLLTVTAVTVLIQALVGVLLTASPTPTLWAWIHTGLATLSLGLLTASTLLAWPRTRNRGAILARIVQTQEEYGGFSAWLTLATVAAFILVLTGAAVAQSQAASACPAFPHCGPSQAPAALQFIQMLHRGAVFATLIAFLWLSWRYVGILGRASMSARRWNRAMLLLFAAQIGLGVANAFFVIPVWVNVAHLALATAVWAGFVVLYTLYHEGAHAQVVAGAEDQAASPRRDTVGSILFAYFWLAKPYITVLLLITTLAAILVATAGRPPWGLTLWALLGGALSASSANTINAYIERDKDKIMPRTRRRPLATARIAPINALIYGLALGALSVVVFLVYVNVLSAILSTIALVYYVVVYTLWLKPRTPYNIVIGGAAGAFPPMIGWTAITGQIDPLAIILFAVVFCWTPPHTWALTLLAQRDYTMVNIPMWPVVHGEEDTRKQIVAYTWPMLIVTILPAVARLLGPIYLVAAVVLGGIFLYLALRLRQARTNASALSLYKYSTLYLALLFAAMVVDRVV